MPQYMLLLYGDGKRNASMSPEEMQQMIGKYRAWSDELRSEQRLGPSNKLQDGTGRVLRSGGGKPVITDGPYAESKEVVAGYYTLQADSYDHAVELATGCPHVHVGTIEIREIQPV